MSIIARENITPDPPWANGWQSRAGTMCSVIVIHEHQKWLTTSGCEEFWLERSRKRD
jgi:hypothetical protein